jgi:hypothetical protein
MRMTTVIRASVSVATRDMRFSVDGTRSLATPSARPMGVTRRAGLTGRGGGGGRTVGVNIARCIRPCLRSQFSRSRDRILMAA